MAFDPTQGDSGPTNQTGNSDLMKQIAAALAAAGGGLAGRALANGSGNSAVPPQLTQLLQNSVDRQGYQNPLFQAATQGSYAMLPTFAKQGTQLSGSLPSTLPPAAPTSGGGGGGAGAGLAGGAGLAALAALLGGGGGSGGGGNLSSIINGLKKLFGKKKADGTPDWAGPIDNQGFNSDPFAMDPNNFPGYNDPSKDPFGSVTSDEFMGPWPETSTPFDPFDPSLLGPGSDEPLPPSGWSKP